MELCLGGHSPADLEAVVTPCEILIQDSRPPDIIIKVTEAHVLCRSDPPQQLAAPARLLGIDA
jgi:hypothetical protein